MRQERGTNRKLQSGTARLTGMAAVLLAGAWLLGAGGASAAGEQAAVNRVVDERLGLLERELRLWKIPLRYTAARSVYFQPGLPPYRQQPEKAREQPLPDSGPEAPVSMTPAPVPSGSSDGESSPAPDTGDSAPSSGSPEPSFTLIEPTPDFTLVQPDPSPTPTQTPGSP